MVVAIGFGDAEHLVLAQLAAVGLLDMAVLVFDQTPPVGVS